MSTLKCLKTSGFLLLIFLSCVLTLKMSAEQTLRVFIQGSSEFHFVTCYLLGQHQSETEEGSLQM